MSTTTATTTTLLPAEAVLTTKMPDYAPILNPITGKPIGLVSNENGKFFAINEKIVNQTWIQQQSLLKQQNLLFTPLHMM